MTAGCVLSVCDGTDGISVAPRDPGKVEHDLRIPVSKNPDFHGALRGAFPRLPTPGQPHKGGPSPLWLLGSVTKPIVTVASQ